MKDNIILSSMSRFLNIYRCDIQFKEIAEELLQSENLQRLDSYIQHGNTTCLQHSIAVAYYSLLFSNLINLPWDKNSLVRGALLHDYFLYDWHDVENMHNWHGFTHPKTAYLNARQDFGINIIEANIILRHMFPLTPVPPYYKEGILVSLVDKMCSVYEVISRQPYLWMKQKQIYG